MVNEQMYDCLFICLKRRNRKIIQQNILELRDFESIDALISEKLSKFIGIRLKNFRFRFIFEI